MASADAMVAVILLTVLTVLLTAWLYARRYQKAGPNEALVVYGRKREGGVGYTIVPPGGGMFILPVVQAMRRLDLSARTLELRLENVMTKEGIPITIDLSIVFQITHEKEGLERAAQMLTSKTLQEVERITEPIVSSAARMLAAQLRVDALNDDRVAFGERTKAAAATGLQEMGLEIRSLLLKDVRDEVGYLNALGKARTTEAIRDAIIRQAIASRDIAIAEGRGPAARVVEPRAEPAKKS